MAILAVTLITAIVALVRWLDGQPPSVFLAPAGAFAIWALGREVDPDHDWTALVASAGAAVWAFRDVSLEAIIAFAMLTGIGRLMGNTTGRRPLPSDLVVVSLAGVIVGTSAVGWAGGFGLAIALYVDDRMSGSTNPGQVIAAAATAVGTTVLAAVNGAFAGGLPAVVPYFALASGVAALLLVVREPAQPTSVVDAGHASPISGRRLHVSRATVGIVLLAMTLLAGAAAPELAPAILMVVLAIAANERELARR